ncbi:MAG: S41 family peptidase [Butyrivibrio sp.]|uniref:S41 family peptidase n=1 Tax=Butyrivibrio sp. TaxID=28121 RepID=UPI001B0D229A|nr:S41 family peptidase [Butyrivibrio sp.]MBO6242606.1 S41 family peptidase [Butyrivibrio sp.]
MDYQNGFDEQQYRGRLNRRFLSGILVGCFVALFISAAVCIGYLLTLNVATVQNEVSGSTVLSEDILSKINKIEAVIDTNFYKTDVTTEDKANGLYKGLMESLDDPYSVYYTEEELTELMNDTEGIYYGIGAYVSMDQTMALPRISGVMEGSPAEEAQLQTDDIIYEVNKESTQGLELSEVVSLIKGEEGTTVHLTLLRGSDLEEIEVDVMRAKVSVPTVKTEVMEDGIGYLQITEFDEVTPDQFTEGMAELRANNIEGLIIDLRSNPGGSLTAVCDIARQLLPKGTIVYTVDREGNREDYTCDGTHEIDIPVVVLVNKYSASASEILSGAIKDYGIGTLVGTTTYGKGIVQRIFDLKDGTAIKLTVSNYYTPNGSDIHGVGIEPDVEVEFDADAYAEDKTDNQLNKAIEVLKESMSEEEEKAG